MMEEIWDEINLPAQGGALSVEPFFVATSKRLFLRDYTSDPRSHAASATMLGWLAYSGCNKGLKMVSSFRASIGIRVPDWPFKSKNTRKGTSMIHVKSIKPFSGNFDRTGHVRPHEWKGDNFWVRVNINGKDSLIARRDLREM